MARKVGVTREDVVAAAAAIADRDGFDTLTLAAVAQRLGVRAPSLYAHVEGAAGLRRLLAMHGARLLADVARRVRADTQRSDPAATLAALSRAYRAFAHQHPGLYAAIQSDAPDPASDPDLAALLQQPVAEVAEVLRALGVSGDDTVHAVRCWRAALHGFVDLEQRGGFGLPQAVDETFTRLVELLIAAFGSDSAMTELAEEPCAGFR